MDTKLTTCFHCLWENNTWGESVSYCCCNKLPQTRWPKTTHIYYLTVPEVRSQKSVSFCQNQGVSRAVFHLQALEKYTSLALAASRNCLHSSARGHMTPTSDSAGTSSSLTLTLLLPSCKDSSDDTEPTQIIQDDHLISRLLT